MFWCKRKKVSPSTVPATDARRDDVDSDTMDVKLVRWSFKLAVIDLVVTVVKIFA